jgi:hypothetical protein
MLCPSAVVVGSWLVGYGMYYPLPRADLRHGNPNDGGCKILSKTLGVAVQTMVRRRLTE